MNRSELDKISLQTLAQQAPNHLLWIVCSALGIITNFLVLVTIVFSKQLRNNSQFVIFSYSVSELCSMSAYFGTGLARYLAYAQSEPQTSDAWFCAIKQTPVNIAGTSVRAYSLVLALDRLLCVAFPIFYRTLRPWSYITALNIITFLYGALLGLVGFAYVQTISLIPICSYIGVFEREYTKVSQIIDNCTAGTTAAMYFGAASVLFHRYKKAQFVGEIQRKEWQRQVDFDVFIAILVMGVIFLLCTGTTSILGALTLRQTDSRNVMVLTFFNTLVSFVSSISHLLVYLKFNPRFRNGFLRLFRRSVGPV